jgi:protein-L-isoaspartate(D-aspartate) O-methyltransferase
MDKVLLAFAKYDRQNFLPDGMRKLAHADWALPIGYDQTNSQPTTVKLMLNWLDVQPGDKVLDVGSGSGWTTALLSFIAGDKGHVYAVERVPQLVDFGRQNARRAGVKNASFRQAGQEIGLPQNAPYDRILVSAAAPKMPKELIDQLKPGGKLVIPVRDAVWEVIKDQKGSLKNSEHPGFAFVPLI